MEWQVLNVVHDCVTASRQQIGDAFRFFDVAGVLEKAIDSLVKRGLVERDVSATPLWRLTIDGRRVPASALHLQTKVRELAVHGISESDSAAPLQVLQRLVESLGSGDLVQPAAQRPVR